MVAKSHKNTRLGLLFLTWTFLSRTIPPNRPAASQNSTGQSRGLSGSTSILTVGPRKIRRRRMLMTRNILRISLVTIFVAMLHMSVVPAVWGQDQEDSSCSMAGAAGEWGYVYTGTLLLPTGPVPVAAVGRYTLDKEGNVSGTQTRTVAPGEASHEVIKGTATV